MLPGAIGAKGMTLNMSACRIKFQQFTGNVFSGFTRRIFGFVPFAAAQSVQGGFIVMGADVARETIRLMNRHIQHVGPGKLDHQVFALAALDKPLAHPSEAPDAIFDVYDIITGCQVREGGLRRSSARRAVTTWFRALPAEYLGIRKQMNRPPGFGFECPALGKRAFNER